MKWINKKTKVTTEKRTLQQVNQEYAQTCAQLGDFWHRLQVTTKDMETINRRLNDLDLEANVLKAEEAASNASKAKEAAELQKAATGKTEQPNAEMSH